MALHSQFKLKIVTWNVNSVKARLNNILNYIKDTHPDIILLQETKTEDKSFPIQEFKNTGYYVEVFGQKSYNGVAIISKFKPELVLRGLPNFKDDTQARYIQCEIKNFVLSSIYIPNGNPLDTEKFILNPGILDSALHSTIGLIEKTNDSIMELPFLLKGFNLFRKYLLNLICRLCLYIELGSS